uniref:Hemolysin-like secreted salivary protein 3 n=1 Tax=Triatoma infestans TaxID=30076 RepID=A6YPQ6_TRIIF|nr:hemolysin-like secreted salivary protein 3 [Triatoma infestans]
MAIALLFFCSLLLATSLGQYGYDRTLNQAFGRIADVVNQGVEVAQEKTRLTTQLTNSALEHGTNLGKMGVAAGTTLTSKGLGGVSDIGKQGLDLTGTVVEIVPGAELLPVRTVTDAGKTGVTVLNNIGQKGIKSTNYLGSEVLDKTKTITKITTGTVDNLSSAGTAITKETVSTAANAVANLLNTGVDAFRAFMPGGSTETNEILDIPQPELPKVAEPEPENKIAEHVTPPPVVKPDVEPNAIESVPGVEPEPVPSGGISSYISSGLSYIGR